MPLYEMVYICKTNAPLTSIAATMKQKAESIYKAGGVVRRLDNMGIMALTYPMYRHREKFYKGRWVYMLFDGSPDCVQELQNKVAQDVNIFRWAVYKQNDVFSDTYSELYSHFGLPRGEAQQQALPVNLAALREMLQQREQHNNKQ